MPAIRFSPAPDMAAGSVPPESLRSSTVRFRGNSASYNAGGVYCSSTLVITGSTIRGNSTFSSTAYGGGIVVKGTLTLTDSDVSMNSATGTSQANGGGIYQANSAKTTVTNCTISGNFAKGASAARGGGLYCSSSGTLLTITNSTIAGNSATTTGGGVYYASDAATVTNSTVTMNNVASAPNLYGSLSAGSGFNLIDTDPGFVRNPRPGRMGWGDGGR